MNAFDYDKAFSRNLGWFLEQEQLTLKDKCIAISGMGGVGGIHLLTLVRLGVENFHIADFDHFEIHNFNRQVGANITSIDKSKTAVMIEMAKDINPNVKVKTFGKLDQTNMLDFLKNTDGLIDSIDLFEIKMRRNLMQVSRDLKIPVVIAAPIGMGTAYLVFNNESMHHDQYFGFKDNDENEILVLKFILGLTPNMHQAKYLMDKTKSDLKREIVPSTMIGCNLCAGVAATALVKLLLQRGKVNVAPYYHHFDSYLNKFKIGKLYLGSKNPFQKLKYTIAKKIYLDRIDPKLQ